MGFRVQLAGDSYSVEPGVAASVALDVTNEGAAPIKVEVMVEGLDPEWVAIPVPVIEVPAGEKVTERLYLKPPREPESLSGTYPFAVVARVEGGDSKRIPCSLQVKPFHNVSIDVQPRRGLVSHFSREAVFHATVMNLGNVEHTVRLFANDHDEYFAFEFDQEQLTISPGAQRTVSITATAVKKPLLANARLQQLTVSARSQDDRTVASATHAQIEQRALISPGMMWLAALIVFFVGAGVLLWPKKPVVDAFTVSPERVWLGDAFTVEWSASNARSVELTVDGTVYGDLSPRGTKTINTEGMEGVEVGGKQMQVSIRALSGRLESATKSRLVAVHPKEIPADPEILEFSITPTELKVGDPFLVTYKLSDSVTEAILLPTGQELEPRGESVPFTALFEGEFDYRLIARNAAGQEVEKVVHISVARGSKASIVVFRVEPALVDPLVGRVTLTWQVENSVRTELYENDRLVPPLLTESQGVLDRIVDHDTVFRLRVYDNEGDYADKEVTVKTYIPPESLP